MKLTFILALFCSSAYAECVKHQIKVAVIDTGFGYGNIKKDAKLCHMGHMDFSRDHLFSYLGLNNLIPRDTLGHGTNIVGIIEDYAKKSKVDYCIVILKFYSKDQSNSENLKASIAAINFANDEIRADFINYSGGGPSDDSEEREAVLKFLNRGGKFIAAAGNDEQEIGSGNATYYPAMYDKRIVVVGNLNKHGVRSRSSNYGSAVNRWEIGENVTGYGVTLTGTSMSTAIATGKILNEVYKNNQCNYK